MNALLQRKRLLGFLDDVEAFVTDALTRVSDTAVFALSRAFVWTVPVIIIGALWFHPTQLPVMHIPLARLTLADLMPPVKLMGDVFEMLAVAFFLVRFTRFSEFWKSHRDS